MAPFVSVVPSPARDRRRRLVGVSLAALGLAAPTGVLAQGAARLDEISVAGEAPVRAGGGQAAAAGAPGGNVATDPNAAATSGGGGGPSGITGYTARIATAGTKTNTPVIEVPQAISVVTREQLNDYNAQSFAEAVAYVPGAVSARSGYDPRFDQIFIRGFDVLTNQGLYRDGLRIIGSGFAYPKTEPYGAEAITVLRGPAAGLYGLGSPGGILDVTSKRPVFRPFGEAWFQAGNFDRYQGNIDLGAPVEGTDGTMAWRLTGVRRESGSFIGLGTNDDRTYIAPAFTWKPDADTTFTFLSEYQVNNLPATTFYYNAPGFLVTPYYMGDPAFAGLNQEQYRVGYSFEHRFSPDLVFRQNFRHYGLFLTGKYVDINGISADGTSATRDNGYIRSNLVQETLDTQLEGRFVTGPVAHTMVGGVDYARYSLSQRLGFIYGDSTLVPDLNLVTRNYGQQVIATPPLGPTQGQIQNQVGVYLQDQMRFGDVILTLNGRHDWVYQDSLASPDAAVARQDNTAFTGRVGLGYVLAPGLVPYASYATTFTPQIGLDRNGQAFKPASGDQIEAGVKYLIPGTSIQVAFAGFDIVNSSILRTDPANIAFQTATGAVRSRGFEAEATANLGPGTNLVIAYTHADVTFVRGTTFDANFNVVSADGNRVSGIPADTYASFLTYAFPPASPFFGLQLGGGIRYIGSSYADDANTVRNTAVTLYDALVAYDFAAIDPAYRGFRAQLNGYNVFDRTYTTCSFGFCNRNQPATVIGSLIYRW